MNFEIYFLLKIRVRDRMTYGTVTLAFVANLGQNRPIHIIQRSCISIFFIAGMKFNKEHPLENLAFTYFLKLKCLDRPYY